MRKRMLRGALAVAATIWQLHAGIGRCGTIDGGVLLAPVVFLVVFLAQGVSKDLREAFGGISQETRRVTNG